MVEITYFTDPLCCWSWAMEPHWQRLQKEHGDQFKLILKMGGLLPCWSMYNDQTNSIQKPIHMGPEWMHARTSSGVYMDDRIWTTDPPASSFPACIAVKTAELQGAAYGTAYLKLARRAVMVDGKNIARFQVLLDLASLLCESEAGFDPVRFRQELTGAGLDAFRADWKEVRYLGITRFPTLVLRYPERSSLMLRGYLPYEELAGVIVPSTFAKSAHC